MAVAVDYYDLLSIPRNADGDAVKEAVKKAMRLWRKKTEASDLSVRQEAEHQVSLIEEARTVLLDPSQRASYDQRLAREGVAAAQPVAPAAGAQDWVSRAREFLARGDYHSAAYAAKEATQQLGNSAESWYLRSRANAGLDRLEDAWYESQEAARMEQANPDYHFNAGMIAEEMGRFDAAINSYQSASAIRPEPVFDLAIGGVMLMQGRTPAALDLISRVHSAVPDDPNANYYLAAALIEAAEQVPAYREQDSYMVTSREEIEQMRAIIGRIKGLRHIDPEFVQAVVEMEKYLDDAGKRRFNRYALAFLAPLAEMGCLGVAIFVIIPMVPLLMVLFGFGSVVSGEGGGFIIFLGLLLLVGEFFLFWQPQWKINRKIARSR